MRQGLWDLDEATNVRAVSEAGRDWVLLGFRSERGRNYISFQGLWIGQLAGYMTGQTENPLE